MAKTNKQVTAISTLGELKKSGYKPVSVKEELRRNLVKKIKSGEPVFEGIYGFEHTVLPDLERAILSRHNIILLGLRGQAKTRIARRMVELLDPYMPIVAGSDLSDDPMAPISRYAKDLIAEKGDATPIAWVPREERFTEKLATPDVSVADLIGDVDPIRAATLKLPYSDERVIHFGLIPRSHRGIFVINELPDLQARIQVALFNMLQEGDIQIRGFRVRMPLDIQFVFTANPEDYTNRGAIITPLKDRIESQILTHYPKDMATARKITDQEADLHPEQAALVKVNELARDLIEALAFEARNSEYVDQKSGVSARMTITALENLVSAAERRALRNGEDLTYVRMSDFWGVIPAITGKVELVYEGEQEGPFIVALNLIGKSVRRLFTDYFPEPDAAKKKIKKGGKTDTAAADTSIYFDLVNWFNEGNSVDMLNDLSEKAYRKALEAVPGLQRLVKKQFPQIPADEQYFLMEFVLHGLAEYSQLNKQLLTTGVVFKDLFSSMFDSAGMDNLDTEEEDDLY